MKRLWLLLLVCVLLLSACSGETPCQTELFAMDTYMTIRVWDGEEALLSECAQLIYALEAQLSVTRSDSELSALNAQGQAELSSGTLSLLAQAICYSEKTEGAFDPTVYPLVESWGFPSGQAKIPDDETLAELLSSVGTAHIHCSDGEVLLDEGTRLDFGAIAKGYAAQCVAEYLAEQGVRAAMINLGGNVQTLGEKPDGTAWLVGIADPEEPSQAVATLRFTGSMALVTSGSYQRYLELDGQRYHHILDPKTGKPADSGLLSVTVLAQDGVLADAYSTALFVMGLEDGVAFWRQEQSFEAVFITQGGSIFATQGASALLSGCDFTEICA